MERRRDRRFDAETQLQMAVLRMDGEEHVPARLRNLSGRGMSLLLEGPVPVGTAVRVEIGDRLLLGEICHVREEANGFLTGLRLQHSLTSMTDLARLVAAIMGESPAGRASPAEEKVQDTLEA